MRGLSLLILLVALLVAGYTLFSEVRHTTRPAKNAPAPAAGQPGVEQRLNESIDQYQESLQQGMKEAGVEQ